MTDTTGTGLALLNAMTSAQLADHLRGCCGSVQWAEHMIAQRPFASTEAMLAACDDACRTLTREDWIEAFERHPRVGTSVAAAPADFRAAQEGQSDVGAALAAANGAYEQRFGFACIMCPARDDSEEMLAITRARLGNAPPIELRIAAEEQRKLARLQLQALVQSLSGPPSA